MRPFPLLPALLTTAFVTATVVDPEHWFGDSATHRQIAHQARHIGRVSFFESLIEASHDHRVDLTVKAFDPRDKRSYNLA